MLLVVFNGPGLFSKDAHVQFSSVPPLLSFLLLLLLSLLPWHNANAVQLTAPVDDKGWLMCFGSGCPPALWHGSNAVQLALLTGDDGRPVTRLSYSIVQMQYSWPSYGRVQPQFRQVLSIKCCPSSVFRQVFSVKYFLSSVFREMFSAKCFPSIVFLRKVRHLLDREFLRSMGNSHYFLVYLWLW